MRPRVVKVLVSPGPADLHVTGSNGMGSGASEHAPRDKAVAPQRSSVSARHIEGSPLRTGGNGRCGRQFVNRLPGPTDGSAHHLQQRIDVVATERGAGAGEDGVLVVPGHRPAAFL